MHDLVLQEMEDPFTSMATDFSVPIYLRYEHRPWPTNSLANEYLPSPDLIAAYRKLDGHEMFITLAYDIDVSGPVIREDSDPDVTSLPRTDATEISPDLIR